METGLPKKKGKRYQGTGLQLQDPFSGQSWNVLAESGIPE